MTMFNKATKLAALVGITMLLSVVSGSRARYLRRRIPSQAELRRRMFASSRNTEEFPRSHRRRLVGDPTKQPTMDADDQALFKKKVKNNGGQFMSGTYKFKLYNVRQVQKIKVTIKSRSNKHGNTYMHLYSVGSNRKGVHEHLHGWTRIQWTKKRNGDWKMEWIHDTDNISALKPITSDPALDTLTRHMLRKSEVLYGDPQKDAFAEHLHTQYQRTHSDPRKSSINVLNGTLGLPRCNSNRTPLLPIEKGAAYYREVQPDS